MPLIKGEEQERGNYVKYEECILLLLANFIRKAAVNFIIINNLQMGLMMTAMDGIRESEFRFQFFLVIFNFNLSLRAPPSTKN